MQTPKHFLFESPSTYWKAEVIISRNEIQEPNLFHQLKIRAIHNCD
jgi:hypothetical protein